MSEKRQDLGMIVVSTKLTRAQNAELCSQCAAAGMTRYQLLQSMLIRQIAQTAAAAEHNSLRPPVD